MAYSFAGYHTNMSAASPTTQQHGSMLLVLMDLIYADIVARDRCCRRMADALISDITNPLKAWVMERKSGLSIYVERSIEIYCIRSLLFRAPDVLRRSRSVCNALRSALEKLVKDLDDELRTTIHNVMRDVKLLHAHLETKRFADVLDALGDIIVGFMSLAAEECEARAERMEVVDEYMMQRVNRFRLAKSAYRRKMKRAREEDCDVDVAELMFGGPSPSKRNDVVSKESSSSHSPQPTPPPPPPAQILADEVHVEHVEDDVATTAEATASPPDNTQATDASQEELSSIVVDPSTSLEVAPTQPTTRRVMIASTEASVCAFMNATLAKNPYQQQQQQQRTSTEADRREVGNCIGQNEVVARSYFLCHRSNRYESCAARGFFL